MDTATPAKPKYAGTNGTLLVAKNDERLPVSTEVQTEHINLDQPALIGMTPPFVGQRFLLRTGKTSIGRREDSDIVLADGSVSSLHAWIIEDGGSYRLMNILSTNGSYVNDQRVTEAVLSHGDRLRFGGVELQLHTGTAGSVKKGSAWGWMIGLGAVLGLAALVAIGWVLMHH